LRKLRLFAAAAAAALVVAGCGGGDDSNKTASYSDFGQQASQVCTAADPDIKATTQKLTGKASEDAAVYDELIPKLEAASQKFKALSPPDELKADFDRFNSITDQQIALAKKAQAAAKSGNQKAYNDVIKELKQSPLDSQNDEAASKLGASGCIGD
jgi:ABC-type glycerol-3-phosphate transport system substrate-binding protein